MNADRRLEELGIVLPPPPPRGGLYVDAVRDGDRLYLSGKGPRQTDGSRPAGKVGRDYTADEARDHARVTGLNLLAALKAELGSLDRVERIVKLFGMVNAVAEFGEHPKVIDGCSELLVDVFGDRGQHARSAVGVGSLPGNMTVEIEMIVSIRPDA